MSDGLFMNGIRLYQKDQADLAQMAANTQLLQERAQNEREDRSLNPLRAKLLEGQAAHQGTLADLNRVQADVLEAKESREERVASAIAQSLGRRRQRTPDDFDEEGNPIPREEGEGQGFQNLAAAGYAAMDAGDLAKGEKLIKLAAELKHKEAQTGAATAAEKLRQTNLQLKKIDFMREVFSGVKDPDSHSRALLLLQGNSLTVSEKVPETLQTYNPADIAQFLAGSKVATDKARLALQATNVASAKASREAATTVRNFLAGLAEKRTEAYVERVKNTEKAGGVEKSVPSPSGAEVRFVRELLEKDGIEFDDEDDAALLEIAEEVKLRTTRNTSITTKEATAKAVKEAEERGDLVRGSVAKIPVVGIPIPGTEKKSSLKIREGAPTMPLPLPRAANGAVDRSKLEPGKYYRGDDGRIEMWNGTAGVPLSKAVPKPKAGG